MYNACTCIYYQLHCVNSVTPLSNNSGLFCGILIYFLCFTNFYTQKSKNFLIDTFFGLD